MKNENELDILFLGGLFPKELEDEIITKSKGTIQYAANAVQWNLVKGLDEVAGPIRVLAAPFVGVFPKDYKDFFFRAIKWSHTKDAEDKSIGFTNLFGIRQASRSFSLSRETRKWARQQSDGKTLIVYSMNTPFLYAAKRAKMANPNIHICLICPDLPQFKNLKTRKGVAYRLFKPIDIVFTKCFLKAVDSFVFLTQYMANQVNRKGKPWIVMEGVVDPIELFEIDSTKQEEGRHQERIILYTGTLDLAYGIGDLLESFELIEEIDIHLWICGAGEAAEKVRIASLKDSRIKYFGQVPRSEVLKLQREADLLVNPRNDKGEFTKYSFPSKLMEYMASGTPTLVYRLPGVPDEYYDYLLTIEGEGPAAIAQSITRVFSKANRDLAEIGQKARMYVLSNKSSFIQASRILKLVHSRKKRNV